MVRLLATRSQRRLEKKQAVILLAMVLIVSLVSFALGVMVGIRSTRTAVVVPSTQPVRLPVAEAVPPPTAAAPATGERPPDSLTFYDSLPKGGQAPLGSGINLPPSREKEPVAKLPVPASADAAKVSAAATASVVEAPMPAKKKGAAPPLANVAAPIAKTVASAADGSYLVQAASFRRSEDSRGLQAKLARKGYTAFIEEANLGEKGVWYRVYVGPFATAGAADAVVSRLKTEEKLTALVRKR